MKAMAGFTGRHLKRTECWAGEWVSVHSFSNGNRTKKDVSGICNGVDFLKGSEQDEVRF